MSKSQETKDLFAAIDEYTQVYAEWKKADDELLSLLSNIINKKEELLEDLEGTTNVIKAQFLFEQLESDRRALIDLNSSDLIFHNILIDAEVKQNIIDDMPAVYKLKDFIEAKEMGISSVQLV